MTGQSVVHIEKIRVLSERGEDVPAIAARIGITATYVRMLAKQNGISIAASLTKAKYRARREGMLELFRKGVSYQAIADKYGTTWHAVRIAISRTGMLGEAKATAKFKCSIEYLKSLPDGVAQKYRSHRRRAIRRGVGFEMTLPEWWEIWRNSGCWEKRGVHHGEYVMCRKGDIGPYAVGNVFVDLATENISMYWRDKKAA